VHTTVYEKSPKSTLSKPRRRFCAAHYVFSVVKVSSMLTACPYFDNLEVDIFDVVGPQCHFIASLTTAVRIRTLSVHWLKLNLVR